MNEESLSIIVPVFNEATIIVAFVKHLQAKARFQNEIIVVDGGSNDGTYECLTRLSGIKVAQTQKGRALQMNFGAALATNSWLYFVHADCQLPAGYDQIVLNAIKRGITAGCFRMRFDKKNFLLKLASYGTRWKHLLCRGGDQTLFVERNFFFKIGKFDENYEVCEDIDLIRRLSRESKFHVLEETVITSSRRFYRKGIFYLWFHFRILHLLHWANVNPHYLFQYYHKYVQ